MRYRTLTTSLLLALSAAGCSKREPPKTPEPPSEQPQVAESEPSADISGRDPGKAAVVIDPKIAEMCKLPVPKFAFDSSALSSEATATLDALAACFVDGPGAGKAMRLVGHCDPRGTDEYNMALGQQRAASVAGYLENGGIGTDRIETSSRGELDATGTDEATWALDRKVQIFLAN